MYLAYKYIALVALLIEANFDSERLALPVSLPIQTNQLTFKIYTPVDLLSSEEFGGRVDAGGYAFSAGGKFNYIWRIDPFGELSAAEQNEMLSHEKSLISSNQAYQLATNWLTLIDVDVHKLEKTNKWEVRQRWYYGNKDETILLPVFYVRWGDWNEPKVDVSIDGRTKQFIEIRQEDDSFSRRPQELIRDWKTLIAIPDEEFKKYSSLERSNLVARFAVNWSTATNQSHLVSFQTNAIAATNAPAEK